MKGRSRDYRVVVGAGYFSLSGVHVFAIHLVRGLIERGIDAHLLLTEQNTELVSIPPNMMSIPRDIPVRELPVPRNGNWADHWFTTICYLEEQGPCIYLPNVDYRHSCVSPKLSRNVPVIGVIQGDDPIHYEHVRRLGRFWDAIVGVSDECSQKVIEVDASYKPRVYTIPNACPVPRECPRREQVPGGPLRFIYHGVLNTYQKRILDVADILDGLDARGVPFQFTIAGSGPEQEPLLARCQKYIDKGSMTFLGMVPNDRIPKLLASNDAYILTSRFEGMPHAVIEAMAVGCVPVVTDVASGVPELITNGVQGYRIPVGDIQQFVDRLAFLQKEPFAREQMALQAHHRVLDSPFDVNTMVTSYTRVFDRVMHDAENGIYQRPVDKVLPPPAEVDGLSIFPVECGGYIAEVDRLLPARPL